MSKVAFYTLGCKVNQVETEAMIELFEKKEYQIVDVESKADVYVINTCTVTNMSDRKSRQVIRRAKRLNQKAIIAVVGCYAQIEPNKVLEIEGVDLIVGTQDRNKIVELCEEASHSHKKINAVEDIMNVRDFEEMTVNEIKGKTRGFIKIQEGCNQYCSYCIIPYARGPIRSRKLSNILKEVEKLSKVGIKEIVLTGIHIASYGKDIGNIELIDIIEKVHQYEGIERIRLSSIEPTLITRVFMERLIKLPKVCNHFHLSLQSGSDTVLKKMNRKYTTEKYGNIVRLIRDYMPEVGLTTDIIVGFPGETKEEFSETYQFAKAIGFSKIHVFKYSPRSGTPASKHQNQIRGDIKDVRSKKLIELGEELTKAFNNQFINKTMGVLIEDYPVNNQEYLEGYTTNYIRVMIKGDEELKGQIVPVLMKEGKEEVLIGDME